MQVDAHRDVDASPRRTWPATQAPVVALGLFSRGRATKEQPIKSDGPVPALPSAQISPEVLRKVKGATVPAGATCRSTRRAKASKASPGGPGLSPPFPSGRGGRACLCPIPTR